MPSAAEPLVTGSVDQTNAELGQLLLRLQSEILFVDPAREKRLRSSQLERARIDRNLQYARSMLTKLEHESMGLKAQLTKHDLHVDLNRKREMFEILADRLEDLNQLELSDDDDDSDFDGEDILAGIIATPSDSLDSQSADPHAASQTDDEGIPPPPSVLAQQERPPRPESEPDPGSTQSRGSSDAQFTPTSSPTNTTASVSLDANLAASQSSLRARRSAPQSESYSTARNTLLSRRRGASSVGTAPATTRTSTATAEAILDNQRAEQEALVDNILQYATALRDNSQRFNDTLEKDKAVLERAGEGMDRTETGIETARRRMNVLTKMTEGKGWWGRMLLFAWVYGLMVALLLVVFVLPKFRF
ncbi:unnamed protein product [Parascedosporium putredinis]|uniref:Synaptobrevin n=1 Tax=Parascedosporium putredinis TaxID=1442378 RepID=A0A9P1MD77_9PEZI|nr:unnamed protein product [Parascedosporium putredinis]CAI8003089.1 unnamed protein product [Parascedosporium putredinis]